MHEASAPSGSPCWARVCVVLQEVAHLPGVLLVRQQEREPVGGPGQREPAVRHVLELARFEQGFRAFSNASRINSTCWELS